MNKDVEMLLVEARSLISDPQCWVKHDAAKALDRYGTYWTVRPWHPSACKWSPKGAVKKIAVHFDMNYAVEQDAVALLVSVSGNDSLIAFNDNPDTTHSDVLALFDKAIKELEK